MEKELILPPGYYKEKDAEDVYEKSFDTVFRYFTTNFMNGNLMEFGTYKGYSARKIASKMKEYDIKKDFYMFDSFEGLPEIESNIDKNSYQVKVHKDWQKGTFSKAKGYEVKLEQDVSDLIGKEQTHVVKGYFDETLDTIKFEKNSTILVNIDCDLYSSIKTVFDKLISEEVFQDGCVLLLDDYNFNRANNNMGVRKAVSDTFGKQRRYQMGFFFTYGWHGQAFFIHDTEGGIENE